MQEEARLRIVRILVKVLDAVGVERRRATDESVDDVALVEQLLREI